MRCLYSLSPLWSLCVYSTVHTLKLYTVKGCRPVTVWRVLLPPVLRSLVVSQLLSSPLRCLIIYSMTGALWLSSGGAQDRFTVREVKDIMSGLPGVEGTSERQGRYQSLDFQ
jgi:hypothetical protein